MSSGDRTQDAYRDILNSVVTEDLQASEARLAKFVRDVPIPDNELAENVSLFQTVRSLKRLLYLNELYRQILPVHGVVMQFGVRWGRDIAAFEAFRTIYEPFNISRVVIGFDTFEGFPSVDPKDGTHKMMVEGRAFRYQKLCRGAWGFIGGAPWARSASASEALRPVAGGRDRNRAGLSEGSPRDAHRACALRL